MHLADKWHLCDDGVIRSTLLVQVEAADDSAVGELFLVDSEADRTAFSYQVHAS